MEGVGNDGFLDKTFSLDGFRLVVAVGLNSNND